MFAAIVGQGATASAAQLPLLFSLSTPGWATDPHPYNLEVNGVDHIGAVDFRSIEIEMAGPGTNGSLSFELWDPDASVTINEWDEVRFIEHAAERPILFGGFVTNITWRAWAAGGRNIIVTCVGYGILLDKKAVPGWTMLTNDYAVYGRDLGDRVASIVNRHGGLVHGLCADDVTTVTESIVNPSEWYFQGQGTPYPSPSFESDTLRGMINQMVAQAYWVNYGNGYPISSTYWVDAYARLRFFPVLPPGASGIASGYEYDEGMPGFAFDESGGLVDIEYEEEDADRLTAARVTGFRPLYVKSVGADATRILDWTVMANGDHTPDNTQASFGIGFRLVLQHSSTSTVDDVGTVTVAGTDLYGRQVEESFTLNPDKKVRGTMVWAEIRGITVDDWDGTAGADLFAIGTRPGVFAADGRGTGDWYTAPMSRAGDLYGVIVDDNAVSEVTRNLMSAVEVGRTEGVTARGTLSLHADNPQLIWPGRHMTVDYSAVNQDGTVDYRITSVRIKWQSLTARTYDVGYGKAGESPSLARRVARLNRRVQRNK